MASGIVAGMRKIITLNNNVEKVIIAVCDQPLSSAFSIIMPNSKMKRWSQTAIITFSTLLFNVIICACCNNSWSHALFPVLIKNYFNFIIINWCETSFAWEPVITTICSAPAPVASSITCCNNVCCWSEAIVWCCQNAKNFLQLKWLYLYYSCCDFIERSWISIFFSFNDAPFLLEKRRFYFGNNG